MKSRLRLVLWSISLSLSPGGAVGRHSRSALSSAVSPCAAAVQSGWMDGWMYGIWEMGSVGHQQHPPCAHPLLPSPAQIAALGRTPWPSSVARLLVTALASHPPRLAMAPIYPDPSEIMQRRTRGLGSGRWVGGFLSQIEIRGVSCSILLQQWAWIHRQAWTRSDQVRQPQKCACAVVYWPGGVPHRLVRGMGNVPAKHMDSRRHATVPKQSAKAPPPPKRPCKWWATGNWPVQAPFSTFCCCGWPWSQPGMAREAWAVSSRAAQTRPSAGSSLPRCGRALQTPPRSRALLGPRSWVQGPRAGLQGQEMGRDWNVGPATAGPSVAVCSGCLAWFGVGAWLPGVLLCPGLPWLPPLVQAKIVSWGPSHVPHVHPSSPVHPVPRLD
jgi:hypothetical protein